MRCSLQLLRKLAQIPLERCLCLLYDPGGP